MTEEEKDKLRGHWITRALRVSREAYLATGRRDPMYLIMDAACLATPLFGDEPYFQRPTPTKQVGGVIRFRRGTKDRVLNVNVFDPVKKTVTRLEVCEVAEFVDNLGRLLDAISATNDERAQLLEKVQRWVTHDDTLDDTPDAVSWARDAEIRRKTRRPFTLPGNHDAWVERSRRLAWKRPE